MADKNGPGMDLEAFVETTITQILKGVKSALTSAQGIHDTARVNPTTTGNRFAPPTSIDFDVAITVVDTSSSKGGGSIKVFSAGVSGEKGKDTSSESVSRVRFSVPVSLPATPSERKSR